MKERSEKMPGTRAMVTDDFSESQSLKLESLLLQSEANLEEQLNIGKAAADVVTLDQTTVGRVSRMDAIQQQSMAVSMREKASLKLQRVQAALRAITTDEYGYCRQCDERIAYPRLLAQPEAISCFTCQEKTDRQQ